MHLLATLLQRERALLGVALALVAVLAWTYTLSGAGMGTSAAALAPAASDAPAIAWGLAHAVIVLAMWWVMMVAMMLPSAAPTILLAAALNQRAAPGRQPFGPAGLFAAGYLLAWLGFSAVAVAAQRALQGAGWLSPTLAASDCLAATLLLAAGAWQFTAIKRACLRHCRSPVEFLTRRRRAGRLGALAMGLEHGGYCLGCCWFLMALLFVGGAMNPYWIAGLALYVLAEKLLPRGERLAQAAGALLWLGGALLLLQCLRA